MWNLVKAQHYQMRKSKGITLTLLLVVIIPFLFFFIFTSDTAMGMGRDISAGEYMASVSTIFSPYIMMVTAILVPLLVGGDMVDKTLNYEILNGYSRVRVYFSKVAVAIFWSMVCTLIPVYVLLLLCTLINGWGINVDMELAWVRLFLLVFPMFQLVCEMVLVTFLVRNCYIAMALGYTFVSVGSLANLMYMELTDTTIDYVLTSGVLSKLMDFSNYQQQHAKGEEIIVYDVALQSGYSIEIAVSSVLIGVTLLVVGYLVFRKQDVR